MNAIIAHGGKQYRVAPGDVLRVEKLGGEAGATVELADVRLIHRDGEVVVGDKLVGAKVVATVVRQGRGARTIIFKKKRCKQYRRTRGHRQDYTEIRIERIG